MSEPAAPIPLDAAHALYDALMDARPFIAAYVTGESRDRTPTRIRHAQDALDRCDAALADAADYLQGGAE